MAEENIIFIPNLKANTLSTHLVGEFTTSYKSLLDFLGPPKNGDGYKVSTEWILSGPGDSTFTIYDYKATNMYADEEVSVEIFRNLPSYTWHIGGKGPMEGPSFQSFVKWLQENLDKQTQQSPCNSNLQLHPAGSRFSDLLD
mgnify:CR=1 FL=1